jgi:hypothetical protein
MYIYCVYIYICIHVRSVCQVTFPLFAATIEAFEKCLNQNAWVAAYFAGLDIGADDAGAHGGI